MRFGVIYRVSKCPILLTKTKRKHIKEKQVQKIAKANKLPHVYCSMSAKELEIMIEKIKGA